MNVPITFKAAEPRNSFQGRAGHPVVAIVHHRMVGFLPGTDRHFAQFNPKHPVSTHLGIGTRTPGGAVEISQYVDLSDTAFGNGNHHPSGGWPLFHGVNPNFETVSIEHQDGAKAGRGVVTEAIIEASIWLDRLLLSGDVAAMRAAGIRVRDPATAHQLGQIVPGPDTIIDHHRVAGKLKPFCWRRWLDDAGFPQDRYLAAITSDEATALTTNAAIAPTIGGDPMLDFSVERWHIAKGMPFFEAPGGQQRGLYSDDFDITTLGSPTGNPAWFAALTLTGGVSRVVYVRRSDLSEPTVAPPATWRNHVTTTLRSGAFGEIEVPVG